MLDALLAALPDSVDDIWRVFKTDDLCGTYGGYQAFSGPAISNPNRTVSKRFPISGNSRQAL